jgi:hypothetical protein
MPAVKEVPLVKPRLVLSCWTAPVEVLTAMERSVVCSHRSPAKEGGKRVKRRSRGR